jgi:PhnB protein
MSYGTEQEKMTLTPHLSFDGQCQAAFKFYERCLGGRIITMLTWGDSPMAAQGPPEMKHKILHATLMIGGGMLAGSDAPPGQYQKPQGCHVLIGIDDPVKGEQVFHALAENGTVRMPFQKTFWARGFGVLTDQFGVSWEINCEQAATHP